MVFWCFRAFLTIYYSLNIRSPPFMCVFLFISLLFTWMTQKMCFPLSRYRFLLFQGLKQSKLSSDEIKELEASGCMLLYGWVYLAALVAIFIRFIVIDFMILILLNIWKGILNWESSWKRVIRAFHDHTKLEIIVLDNLSRHWSFGSILCPFDTTMPLLRQCHYSWLWLSYAVNNLLWIYRLVVDKRDIQAYFRLFGKDTAGHPITREAVLDFFAEQFPDGETSLYASRLFDTMNIVGGDFLWSYGK